MHDSLSTFLDMAKGESGVIDYGQLSADVQTKIVDLIWWTMYAVTQRIRLELRAIDAARYESERS